MSEHPDRQVKLVIESGLQAGVTLVLRVGCYSVGAGLQNDVVLIDRDIPDTVCKLVVLDGGQVHVNDGCGPDFVERLLKSGASLRYGSTTLRIKIEDGRSVHGVVAPAYVSRTPRGLLMSTLVMLLILAPIAHPNDLGVARSRIVPAGYSTVWRQKAPQTTQVGNLGDMFAAYLARVGLATLHVMPSQEGSLEVSGSLDVTEEKTWQEAERWLDQHMAGRVLLIDHTQIIKSEAPLSIGGVFTGSFAYVVDREGRRFVVGDVLDSGWAVEAIKPDRVVLRREGQSLAVRF